MISHLRRAYEPGDWWRWPVLLVVLLLARLFRVAVPDETTDEGE